MGLNHVKKCCVDWSCLKKGESQSTSAFGEFRLETKGRSRLRLAWDQEKKKVKTLAHTKRCCWPSRGQILERLACQGKATQQNSCRLAARLQVSSIKIQSHARWASSKIHRIWQVTYSWISQNWTARSQRRLINDNWALRQAKARVCHVEWRPLATVERWLSANRQGSYSGARKRKPQKSHPELEQKVGEIWKSKNRPNKN